MANEKRLIDANALIRQFDGYGWGGECDGEIVLGSVADAPTVDAVEVVRCEDCVYNQTGSCSFSEYVDPYNYNPKWFCADGERKDNESSID